MKNVKTFESATRYVSYFIQRTAEGNAIDTVRIVAIGETYGKVSEIFEQKFADAVAFYAKEGLTLEAYDDGDEYTESEMECYGGPDYDNLRWELAQAKATK